MSDFLTGVTALRAVCEIVNDLPSELAQEVLVAAIAQIPTDRPEPAVVLPFRTVTAEPEPEPDGRSCAYCGETGTPQKITRHIRSAHWDDVLEEYAEGGCPGLVEAFGVSMSTASNWRDLIEGAE